MNVPFKIWAQIALWNACWLQALAQTPPVSPDFKTSELSEVVSKLQDEFLVKVEQVKELDPVFEAYEARCKSLMGEYPGRPEPFVGLMELFEKCGNERTQRILDENLARSDLPEKIRTAYEALRRTAALIGSPLDLAFTTVDGRVVRFDQFHGKVVVIDFWATWCGPCVRDLPKMQAFYEAQRNEGLAVVGISFDRERPKFDAFLKARQIPWAQIYPTTEEREKLAHSTGVTGGYLPTVFILGKDGRLRHTLNSRFRLEEKLLSLLKE